MQMSADENRYRDRCNLCSDCIIDVDGGVTIIEVYVLTNTGATGVHKSNKKNISRWRVLSRRRSSTSQIVDDGRGTLIERGATRFERAKSQEGTPIGGTRRPSWDTRIGLVKNRSFFFEASRLSALWHGRSIRFDPSKHPCLGTSVVEGVKRRQTGPIWADLATHIGVFLSGRNRCGTGVQ